MMIQIGSPSGLFVLVCGFSIAFSLGMLYESTHRLSFTFSDPQNYKDKVASLNTQIKKHDRFIQVLTNSMTSEQIQRAMNEYDSFENSRKRLSKNSKKKKLKNQSKDTHDESLSLESLASPTPSPPPGILEDLLIEEERLALTQAEPYEGRVDFSKLTFWSTDFHITPISDFKFLMKDFGVKVIDKSLSGHCRFKGTCANDLRVINSDNGYNPGSDHGERLSREFFGSYKSDPTMKQVDGFVCFHPIATCEYYQPFNRSIIAISSTRYEHGHFKKEEWKQFNEILIKWAQNPRNLIGANSRYDQEYLKYFTGLPVEYIPSSCGDIQARYTGRRSEILLGHMHVPHNKNTYWDGGSLVWEQGLRFIRDANDRANAGFSFVPINQMYPGHYEYQQLADHKAMIHIPYQTSVMSFFEQYRMGIPMFFPSLKFMVQLHLDYAIVSERTWARVIHNHAISDSGIPKHPDYPYNFDPNNELDRDALTYWLSFSDYFIKPHIILFDSWDDLIVKLKTTDYQSVSQKMHQHSDKFAQRLKLKWRRLFNRMFHDKPIGGYAMPSSYEEGMKALLDTHSTR